MAARVIAQLIIKGSTILAKAFVTAYQQALNSMRALTIYFYLLILEMNEITFLFVSDAKAGGGNAPNAASTMTRTKNKLHLSEAFQILNIEKSNLSKTVLEEVLNYSVSK
jgi:hypothetical protein